MGPVRDKMIAEEVSSLNQRVRQRATMLQEGLGMGRSTVSMIKSYWLQVLDGNYNWYPSTHVPKLVAAAGAPSFFVKSYFAPFSACTRGKLMDGSVLCGNDATSGLELQAEQGFSIASYEPRKISVEASALYRPEDAARLSSEKLATEAGDSVWSWSNEDEVKGLALLDEVLRAAYFSADVTSVYVATHGSETFKMFPFEDLASYDKEKICDSIMNKPKEVWVPKQVRLHSHARPALARLTVQCEHRHRPCLISSPGLSPPICLLVRASSLLSCILLCPGSLSTTRMPYFSLTSNVARAVLHAHRVLSLSPRPTRTTRTSSAKTTTRYAARGTNARSGTRPKRRQPCCAQEETLSSTL